MFDFNKPNIEITDVSDDKKYGRFVVEPLERGYGTTLGNSLRRIMLSSLPGAAISSVKIDGVLHEFSSIPGVKEDVTEIIMNLKSLAIKNTSESDEVKTAYIEYEGEGVVTGADIQADSDIEIVNPEQVIATLSGGKDSKLYMELTITKGRGYVSSDKNKTEDMPIGVLPIDSIYTPIDRVNLTVQNTRVGQITDYDKLTLDVWTKGTMAPDEAVSLAAKVLSEHLSLFIDCRQGDGCRRSSRARRRRSASRASRACACRGVRDQGRRRRWTSGPCADGRPRHGSLPKQCSSLTATTIKSALSSKPTARRGFEICAHCSARCFERQLETGSIVPVVIAFLAEQLVEVIVINVERVELAPIEPRTASRRTARAALSALDQTAL